MDRLVILGSGAATGVPSLSSGWGKCNPLNPKNKRQRAGIYYESSKGSKILFDTSPDLKNQLIDNNIKMLDAVFYTHTHADHLHGIDDLRGVTRNLHHSLDFYATAPQIEEIKQRFAYAFANLEHKDITNHPELQPKVINYLIKNRINDVEIMPLEFNGHTMITTGYDINNGQVVIVPDFRIIPNQTLEYLKQITVDVLIMPLTMPKGSAYHSGIKEILEYAEIIGPQRVVLTHMASECDYDEVLEMTPENIVPAYDNMIIELKGE